MANTTSRPRLREMVAGEIRVAMVRRQVTGATLAIALGKSQAYVSRRLSGETAFDVDDLETIAATLQVKLTDLIGHAERRDGSYVAPTDREDRDLAVAPAGYNHVDHPIITLFPQPVIPQPRGRMRPAPTGR